MIKTYIIDGNNLLGKLQLVQKFRNIKSNDKRINLALLTERYFLNKKVKVTLHFDGYRKESINTEKVKLKYSGSVTADEEIKHEIINSKNPKTICVITSDLNLLEFAKVNSCRSISSEKFSVELVKDNRTNEEEDKIKSIDINEVKKMFGVSS